MDGSELNLTCYNWYWVDYKKNTLARAKSNNVLKIVFKNSDRNLRREAGLFLPRMHMREQGVM